MTDAIATYRDFIFTPEQSAKAHLKWAETIQTTEGSKWNIPKIDSRVIPERPGELVCIMGRPGDGKSSVMAYRALNEARQIAADHTRAGEIILYVTWDDSVEEIENFFIQGFEGINSTDIAWGRADIDALRRRSVKRARLPIWMMGHSITRSARFTGKTQPRMTPDIVFDTIEGLQEAYKDTDNPITNIAMILVDYIQRIPVPGTHDRISEVTEAVHRMKDLAVRVGTRVIAGVQAARSVEQREWKMATMSDSQYSSAIEQDANKIFSVWRPWRSEMNGISEDRVRTLPDGTRAVYGKMFKMPDQRELPLTDTLFLLQMVKQKGDNGQALWPLYFNPAYLKLADMEIPEYRG